MIRPTCTAPTLATLDGDVGRWPCAAAAPPRASARLARALARCRDLDNLLELLVAVEHAAIHCRIDDDEAAALRALHARQHRALLRRERQASLAHRSVLMLVRGGAT